MDTPNASFSKSPRMMSFSRLGNSLMRKIRGPSKHSHSSEETKPAAPVSKEIKSAPMSKSIAEKKKTPVFELLPNNRDWVVEYYDGALAEPIKIAEPKMTHNVCVRDNKDINVIVEKKINNLTMENCKNVNVVVNSVISSVELIRCQKCKIQILGTCSSANIDNSAGINIYASLESKYMQITTAQIQEANLHVPESAENPDNWLEIPIPCQFVHSLPSDSNQLNTRVSDLYH